MAKAYKTFVTGEIFNEFPGQSWNRMVSAAQWVDGTRTTASNTRSASPGKQNLVLQFVNSTGRDLGSQYPIVSFEEPGKFITDDEDITSEPVFMAGILPDEEIDGFAVLRGPVGKNDIINGVIFGYTWAQVDIKNKSDTSCGVTKDNVTELSSDKSGARIVWAERQDEIDNETGIQFCIVEVGGSSAKVAGDKAMVLQNVPAMSAVDGTQMTATPGKTNLNTIGGDGVHIMRWKRDANGDTITPPVDLEEDKNDAGDPNKMDAVNMSMTGIRASTEEPVLVTGYVEDTGGEKLFIITNVMDFRALPNYDKVLKQIPYHESGANGFKVGGEEC